MLNPMETIEEIFENDPPQRKCIHIVIKIPAHVTTRKRSAPVQSSEVTDHVPKSPRLSQETG
ncbi:hypothetical protein L211DRAFT_843061 [Terfezia boudieri ATCC MYA-4762]|uniref:Uncharacterized protein n=1 Tax=Terfezia boudieri ATCC MYA-4762 TaxID=1051890 RepID=A0A3N4LC58_9PEZI|nr:hypothetical protein L211DRAFT_843061 [Terfezia boudieri ATCC MYA-4762]